MPNRISTQLSFDLNLRALTEQQAKLYEVQERIGSGKRVNSPKDDPIGTSRLLMLKQQQASTEQYQESIDYAMAELSLEEVQLEDVLQQLHSAKELIIQANSGANSGSDHTTIALQLEEIQKQLLSIANANIDGRYIFSGAKTYDQAVTQAADGTYVYNGDEVQINAQIGSSLSIATGDTAKSIFFGIPTNDTTIAGFTGRTNITSANGGLVDSGSLTAITANTLKINGIDVAAASSDGVSTTDNTASAIATANAINATTNLHGVVAEANSNIFDFTVGTYTADPLVAGDLTINGVQILGTPAAATCDALVDLINTVNVPGVQASNNGGELRLEATDGRNIQLQTSGNAASLNFTNFATTGGGGALDKVKKGTVSLYDHKAIIIEGSITGTGAGTIDVNTGTYNVTANTGSGVLGQPTVVAARPTNSANNDKYLIKFITPTTFNIYKESAPTTPLTAFKKFSAGQTYKDAAVVQNIPADYAAGDTIIVEGVQFSITGAPVANDTFTVELTPLSNQNIFTSVQNAIDALKNYSDQPEKLSYELGLTLTNLNNSEENVINVNSKIGARQNLAEAQQDSNDDFKFFADKSISAIEDANIISEISDFVKYLTAYQATQQAAVKLQELSLFKYL